MILKKIVLRTNDGFSQAIEEWAKNKNIETSFFDGKESLFDTVDSLVILHEDHNISKDVKELRDALEKLHKSTHQIDINATMNAAVASLRFWIENNKPKSVLFVGNDNLTKSQRFTDYLEKLGAVL
ncbi:hypothetical protein [Crocinitomix catalasitica]|uniref:hypothetical protein n=1 Tax=Crocinitomix catalasitica TaxID=184607 RepID=UPI0004875827|nr:hypothetical protein [Crocinitomix catalasitica]